MWQSIRSESTAIYSMQALWVLKPAITDANLFENSGLLPVSACSSSENHSRQLIYAHVLLLLVDLRSLGATSVYCGLKSILVSCGRGLPKWNLTKIISKRKVFFSGLTKFFANENFIFYSRQGSTAFVVNQTIHCNSEKKVPNKQQESTNI